MLTVVTGAAGFVGSALARRMGESHYPGTVRLIDRTRAMPPASNFESIAADLTDRTQLSSLVRGADRVIHLAALPGTAAEGDPRDSRRINLDVVLDIVDLLAGAARPVRLVHASSIAVFGDALPGSVDDDTAPCPSSTYGTHKRMAELALADAVRRGEIDGVSLRLPGIVARPRGGTGFGSAFVSDLFAAMRAGEPCTLPVGCEATLWLMSARRCADNLLHAAGLALASDAPTVVTLPAVRASMADLVDVLACVFRGDGGAISYAPDPATEARFGRLPPLRTPRAEALGFRSDGGLHALVRAATGQAAAAG